MPDGSDNVEYTEWRIVRLPVALNAPTWPFMELKVGEAFVESNLAMWPSLRTKATRYKGREGRTWSVKKEGEVIIVRRLE